MTPVEAQAFVRYARDTMKEDQFVGALLALQHSDRRAANMIESAALDLAGEFDAEQCDSLGRVYDRVCAARTAEADALRRSRRVKKRHLRSVGGTGQPRRGGRLAAASSGERG